MEESGTIKKVQIKYALINAVQLNVPVRRWTSHHATPISDQLRREKMSETNRIKTISNNSVAFLSKEAVMHGM
jgi:hypothetical protein